MCHKHIYDDVVIGKIKYNNFSRMIKELARIGLLHSGALLLLLSLCMHKEYELTMQSAGWINLATEQLNDNDSYYLIVATGN